MSIYTLLNEEMTSFVSDSKVQFTSYEMDVSSMRHTASGGWWPVRLLLDRGTWFIL